MKIHLKMYSGWWGCAITCNTRWARGGPKTHEAGPTAHEAGPKAHEECYNFLTKHPNIPSHQLSNIELLQKIIGLSMLNFIRIEFCP